MYSFTTGHGALPAALLAALLAAAPAFAAPAGSETVQPPAAAANALGKPSTDELLERSRGGSDSSSIQTTLNGTVGNNSASNVNSGDNIIQSGSFANMSGIPIVIQNSGANVLIQNATVINLQLK